MYSPRVIQDVYVFLSSVENKLMFLMKTFHKLSPYSVFFGLQTVEGQIYSFSAASKGYKRYQTTNKDYLTKRSVI